MLFVHGRGKNRARVQIWRKILAQNFSCLTDWAGFAQPVFLKVTSEKISIDIKKHEIQGEKRKKQAPVVQKWGFPIYRINHYLVDN